MEDLVKASFYLQFFLYNRHKHVNADCDPYLSSHSVRRRTIKGFDSHMLLDPGIIQKGHRRNITKNTGWCLAGVR